MLTAKIVSLNNTRKLGWENYLNELKVDRGLRYKLKRTVEMVGHMIRGKKWE